MTDDDLKRLRKLERVLNQVRTSIDPTVPVQVIHAFIAVALNPGKSLTDIAEFLGSNMSTTSRHLLDLGERNRRMEPGYQLVERAQDPMELRKNIYTLTPKGKLLANSLIKTLED